MMKIVCEKNNDVCKMLELVKRLLETEYMDYPVLEDNLVLEFSLKDEVGHTYLSKEDSILLTEKDLQEANIHNHFWEYCYYDALTGLYNRTKYERDIARLQTDGTRPLACIFIDAVGLHELNNRLGHSAGDCLLRSIAEGMRQYFPNSLQYRIGGDEFVILCFQ